MKKIVFLALVSAFILAQSALTADTYVFDKRHSTMGFQIRHLFEKIPGKFDDFDGKIQFDEANPENSSVDVTIKAASIDTGVEPRDKQLKSSDFSMSKNFRKSLLKASR
jgi:polyisoprenoid-binding protein YceI